MDLIGVYGNVLSIKNTYNLCYHYYLSLFQIKKQKFVGVEVAVLAPP